MGLRKRPSEEADERQIDRLIGKGGSVALEDGPERDPIMNLQLRLPRSLVRRIDVIRERKPKEVRQDRHPWIVEAILEKLKQEE